MKRFSVGDAEATLFRALASLKNAEEARALFADLCTPAEVKTMAQRLQIAEALLNGETYENIRTSHAVSSATIARINAELQYGNGGYKTVLERMEKE